MSDSRARQCGAALSRSTRLRGHPDASTAYAWTYEDDDGKLHHLAVLGVPPINSPVDAVRAAAVAESRTGTKWVV